MSATRFLVLIAALAILPRAAFPKSVPCANGGVLATVVDQKGKPVMGLQQSNFRAMFHRKPLRILSVTQWSGQGAASD